MKTAIILAAGKGSRAWPYTDIRQKVTIPVANVPIVRRLAQDLLGLGIENIVVVVGHRGEAVRSCLADLPGIRFVEQRKQDGTATAALEGVAHCIDDEVLICYGDVVVSRQDIATVLEEFDLRQVDATLLIARDLPGATHWISVELTADNMISKIYPRGDKKYHRFGGILAAKKEEIQCYLLRNPGIMSNAPLGAMPPVEGDLSHSIDLMVEDGAAVKAIRAKGYLVDVDKPWQIVEANVRVSADMFEQIAENSIADDASIDSSAEIAPGAKLVLGAGTKIGKNCRILGSVILQQGARVDHGAIIRPNVIVGENTRCEDYCRIGANSVLGPNSIFGHATEFDGIAFSTVSIRHHAQVCAVLGSHANIAGGVMTGNWRFDDGTTTQNVKGCREKPKRFGEMTYIGDFVRVGNNVVFSPGVKVGFYSCIGPLTYIERDVKERTLLLHSPTEHVQREWGPDKYGW